jgi:co-chaperonin GroES (HSP10)
MREQLPSFYTSEEGAEVSYQDPGLLKLKPYPNRIIVLIDSFSYQGRIIVPDKAKRSPTTGKIVSIGSEVRARGVVKVGQTVVYGLYSGTALKFKGIPVLRVLTEDEIFCEKEGTAEVEPDFPQE